MLERFCLARAGKSNGRWRIKATKPRPKSQIACKSPYIRRSSRPVGVVRAAKSAAAGRFDRQALSGAQLRGGLAGKRLAVDQVASARPRPAAGGPGRRV